MSRLALICSDVNKDWTHKEKDKDKGLDPQRQGQGQGLDLQGLETKKKTSTTLVF